MVELHLNSPGLLTQSLENPCSARKEGQRSRVCTHTALKRNVGFCGLGFLPLSKHASHASKGCASVCWGGGRGWVAGLHVTPKPFYKGGQSMEAVMKISQAPSGRLVSHQSRASDLKWDTTWRWEPGFTSMWHDSLKGLLWSVHVLQILLWQQR